MAKLDIGATMNETLSFAVKRWGTVLRVGWAPFLAIMAASIGAVGLVAAAHGEAFAELEPYLNEEDPSVFLDAALPLLAEAWPMMVLAGVIATLLALVLWAALAVPIQRLVALGEEPEGFFHLRLGATEFQYAAAGILQQLINLFVVGGLAGLGGALFGFEWFGALMDAAAERSEPGEQMLADAGGFFSIMLFGGLILLTYVNVRLIALMPGTAVNGTVFLFGAWRLTKGRFWAVLGASLLFFGLFMAVSIAADLGIGLINATLSTLAPLLGSGLSGVLIGGVLSVLYVLYYAFLYALQLAFPAVVYRRLTEEDTAPAALES